tara:strand:- start:1109 stop:2887 length:1779 start_codon:yes stop_codon:yes gene_type:complete
MAEKDELPKKGNTNIKVSENRDSKSESQGSKKDQKSELVVQKEKEESDTNDSFKMKKSETSDPVPSQELSDEIDGDKQEHEDHKADYSEKSEDDLISEASKILKSLPIQNARMPILAIKSVLTPRWEEEKKEAQEKFIENGGNIIDFYFDQKKKDDFYKVFNEFKKLYSEYRSQLQGKMKINLELKNNLLKEIKTLAENDDLPTGKTYKEFKRINDKWKEIGHVPNESTRDLYASYRFFVDRFYDNLRLAHDLRDIDFKHNKEIKLGLISEIQKLSEKEWSAAMGKELQRFHKEWKESGPVSLDDKESLWKSFQESSNILHEKRRINQETAVQKNKEKLLSKEKIIEDFENLISQENSNHNQWQKATDKAKELRESISKIGRTFSSASDLLWERFKKSEKLFFKNRNQFYKARKLEVKSALEEKYSLVMKAEEIAKRTDWDIAANEMKSLQEKWKKTGFVPKKESEKVWLQFKANCNNFFDAMRSANGIVKKAQKAENARNFKLTNANSTLEKAKKELSQLENNMSFFQFANSESPIVKDAQKKVDLAKNNVEKAQEELKNIKIALRKENSEKIHSETESKVSDTEPHKNDE